MKRERRQALQRARRTLIPVYHTLGEVLNEDSTGPEIRPGVRQVIQTSGEVDDAVDLIDRAIDHLNLELGYDAGRSRG